MKMQKDYVNRVLFNRICEQERSSTFVTRQFMMTQDGRSSGRISFDQNHRSVSEVVRVPTRVFGKPRSPSKISMIRKGVSVASGSEYAVQRSLKDVPHKVDPYHINSIKPDSEEDSASEDDDIISDKSFENSDEDEKEMELPQHNAYFNPMNSCLSLNAKEFIFNINADNNNEEVVKLFVESQKERQKGNMDEALSLLREAQKLNTDDDGNQVDNLAEIHIEFAQCFKKMEQYEEM